MRTWPYEAPTTAARLKKRIVRTLIHEVVADMNHQHAPQSGLCVCYSIPSRAVRAANTVMNGEE